MKLNLILGILFLNIFIFSEEIILEKYIKNFHKVDGSLYRSGQPNRVAFRQMNMYKMKSVINLRTFFSNKSEAKETTNINLYKIPTSARNISYNDIVTILIQIKEAEKPVLIHCWHGSDRTGVVVAAYRIAFQNWSKEEALKELKDKKYGFHGIFYNIPRLIEFIDIEKLKKDLDI